MKFNYLLGVGIVLSLIGASLLVALGFLYIKPFMSTRNYVKGQCRLEYKNTTNQMVQCQCSADGNNRCTSVYPCAKVRVNLTTSASSVHYSLILYDSYETYDLQKKTFHVVILQFLLMLFYVGLKDILIDYNFFFQSLLSFSTYL